MKKIALFSTVLFSLLSCQALQNELARYAPDVNLIDVKLASFDFEGADLDFQYEILNKANMALNFNRLQFDIALDGKRLIDADNKKNIEIEPLGKSQFTISQRLHYTEFADNLVALYKKDELNATLDGKVGVLLTRLNRSIEVPIEAEKIVPVPKIPKVTFKDFKFVNFDSNILNPTAKFELKFALDNPNAFDAVIDSLNYNFNAAGADIIGGSTRSVNVQAKKSTDMVVPVNLKGKQLFDLVPKLRDLSSDDYTLKGDMNLNVAGQNLKIPYSLP